jgi:hypothetical protein
VGGGGEAVKEESRFQVIPRSHHLPVGEELTGLVEHGVATREEAEAGARKVEALYLHRYGPGCPPQDVIEVVTVRPLVGRPGAVAMRCLGRWPVEGSAP